MKMRNYKCVEHLIYSILHNEIKSPIFLRYREWVILKLFFKFKVRKAYFIHWSLEFNGQCVDEKQNVQGFQIQNVKLCSCFHNSETAFKSLT